MTDCHFLWVPTPKGKLAPVILCGPLKNMRSEETRYVQKFPLNNAEAALPLVELEKKYPAPEYQVSYD